MRENEPWSSKNKSQSGEKSRKTSGTRVVWTIHAMIGWQLPFDSISQSQLALVHLCNPIKNTVFPKTCNQSFFSVWVSGLHVPYRLKVSWHSILDPCENRELRIELRIKSRFSIVVSWFSIPARLIKPGRNGLCLQTIIKRFCFEKFALYSRYSIAARIYQLCSSFEQSSNFSHIAKKISLLYKITNSNQRLILARNSWTMQIIQ